MTPLDQSVLYGVSRLTSTVARDFALSFLFGPFYSTIFSDNVLVWTHTEQIVHKFQVRVTTFSKHKLLLCLNRLAKKMFSLSLEILRSLDANHLSLTRCAKEYGWHVTLLRQITGPFGRLHGYSDVSNHNADVKEEKRRGEEDLIDTVLEIVFRVMWKGVEGFREYDWKVKTFLHGRK